MRTIEIILGEAKRVMTVATFTTVVLVAGLGSAHAQLCNSLASDNFDDLTGATTIMVSPNGITGECVDICGEWSKLCSSVLVAHNKCVAGLFKSVLKTYNKYCKIMTDPVEKAECDLLVSETKAEAKALLKADTVAVKAQCAGYVPECIDYCVANS